MSAAWVEQGLALLEHGPCVLVTMRQIKGSAPRASGVRMVVAAQTASGSIGGGNLEHQAIATAREILQQADRSEGTAPASSMESRKHPAGSAPLPRLSSRLSPRQSSRQSSRQSPRLQPYGLGPALNQCCGGSVELMFEALNPPAPDWLQALDKARKAGDPAVLATATSVAGAGAHHHVALPVGHESSLPEGLRDEVRRLLRDSTVSTDGTDSAIHVLEADGCNWWLQRVAEVRKPLLLFGAGHVGKAVVKALADLPFAVRWVDSRELEFPDHIPRNTSMIRTDDPIAEVDQAAPHSIFIVMTHSHQLDEEICHAVLKRADFAFLGLIGSRSKARRFVHRLARRGIGEAVLERLVCPIGLPGISGKEPATIALSLAAQLMSEP